MIWVKRISDYGSESQCSQNRYTTDVYYDIKEIQGVVGVKCDTL